MTLPHLMNNLDKISSSVKYDFLSVELLWISNWNYLYLTVKQFDALWKDHWRPQVDFVTNRGFWDLSAPSKCPFPWTKIDFCSNLSLEVRLLRRKCLHLNDLVHCYQAWALSAWEVLEVIRVSKPPANSSLDQDAVDSRSDVPLLVLE